MKTQNQLAKVAAPIFAKLLAAGGHCPTVSLADTAKLIRAALKDAFPATAFSVRSSSYSMGCSIRVSWVDGPTAAQVDAIADRYEGAAFDGSIDMKTFRTAWLSPEGVASIAHSEGTQGSGGYHREVIGDPNHPNAIEVSFCGCWVSTNREHSNERRRAALAAILAQRSEFAELNPAPAYKERVWGEHVFLDLTSDPYLYNCYLSTLIGRHLADTDCTASNITA